MSVLYWAGVGVRFIFLNFFFLTQGLYHCCAGGRQSPWEVEREGERVRNVYVTALRCPGIYFIIFLNEVGEAPKNRWACRALLRNCCAGSCMEPEHVRLLQEPNSDGDGTRLSTHCLSLLYN